MKLFSRWPGLLVATALASISVVVLPASTAAADGSVSITNEFGSSEADTTYSTEITVTGSGFQSVAGAFGGIYVLFGTVDAGWQPSQGGATGSEYRYVPDSESVDNAGFQRFVSFPGSETESAANGGVLAADGTWSVTMVVPGPTFESFDRNNSAVTVDCLRVTCGVITVGAHGVPNANNETFTPVSFVDLYSENANGAPVTAVTERTDGATDAPVTDTAAADPAGTDSAADTAATVVPEPPAVQEPDPGAATAPAAQPDEVGTEVAVAPTGVVDLDTAVVGRLLTFTGTGFRPGDQVIAGLDDGLAAAGPLTAGGTGAVAGVLQLPPGAGPGTHILRLTAAGSDPVDIGFAVRADPAGAVTTQAAGPVEPVAAAATEVGGWTPARIFLIVSIAVLVLVALLVVRSRRLAHPRRPGPGTESDRVDPVGPTTEPVGAAAGSQR